MQGAPCRFTDPARFSVAHGGKDRHPFPVPLKIYDETIKVLKSAVQKAKLGRDEELGALRRLDEQSRKLELHAKQTVSPSRTSLRKSLIARIPTVGVPFSAGSRHQQILPIELAPHWGG